MKELQEVLVSMRKIFFYMLWSIFLFSFFMASIETDLCVATGFNNILNNTGKKSGAGLKPNLTTKIIFSTLSHYLFYLLNGTSCLIS